MRGCNRDLTTSKPETTIRTGGPVPKFLLLARRFKELNNASYDETCHFRSLLPRI